MRHYQLSFGTVSCRAFHLFVAFVLWCGMHLLVTLFYFAVDFTLQQSAGGADSSTYEPVSVGGAAATATAHSGWG